MSWKIVPRNNAKHQLIQSDCYHESPLPNLTGIVRKSILYMCAHCTIAMIQIDLIFKRIEAIEASRLRFEDVVICCFNTIRIFLTQRRSAATGRKYLWKRKPCKSFEHLIGIRYLDSREQACQWVTKSNVNNVKRSDIEHGINIELLWVVNIAVYLRMFVWIKHLCKRFREWFDISY